MTETPCTCWNYEPLDDIDENPCAKCGHSGEDHNENGVCLSGHRCYACPCGKKHGHPEDDTCWCEPDPNGGWTPLVDGCRMPEHDVWVNVTSQTLPWTMPSGEVKTYEPEIRLLRYVLNPHDEEYPDEADYFLDGNTEWVKRNGVYEAYRSVLTAWRPAPKPFRMQA